MKWLNVYHQQHLAFWQKILMLHKLINRMPFITVKRELTLHTLQWIHNGVVVIVLVVVAIAVVVCIFFNPAAVNFSDMLNVLFTKHVRWNTQSMLHTNCYGCIYILMKVCIYRQLNKKQIHVHTYNKHITSMYLLNYVHNIILILFIRIIINSRSTSKKNILLICHPDKYSQLSIDIYIQFVSMYIQIFV